MTEIEARYAEVKTFSLPSLGDAGRRRRIELGVRGAPEQVAAAIAEMKTGVTALGGNWEAGA
jgi:hypothetical protein